MKTWHLRIYYNRAKVSSYRWGKPNEKSLQIKQLEPCLQENLYNHFVFSIYPPSLFFTGII